MPSGAKKRKAAKKKKVHNSSTTNPHQGENDGGELSSPASQDNKNAQDPSVEVEVKGDENKSTEANGEESNVEIETGEKTKSSSSSNSSDSSDVESIEKKEVVLEPAPIESLPEVQEVEVSPVVDPVDETKSEETKELAPPVESLPETIPDTAVEPEVSPIVELVDSSLHEEVKVYDETKNEDRKELLVTETPEVVEEQIVTTEVALKDDLPTSSVVESVSKDHAGETDTVEHSDRQAVVASPPIEERKLASWKNCCGIFELFSGSGR